MLGTTLVVRWLLHPKTRTPGAPWAQGLLLPIRDLLSLGLLGLSALTRRVQWRDSYFTIEQDRSARLIENVESSY